MGLLPAFTNSEDYQHKFFVASMIYTMVNNNDAEAYLISGGNALAFDAAGTNSLNLRKARALIKSKASHKRTDGTIAGSSEKATAREHGELYFALLNVSADAGTTHDEKMTTLANSLSLDVEYTSSPQMPYLLEDNVLNTANKAEMVMKVVAHVKVTQDEINVIQAMGTASTTTAAEKLAASKADSRLEHMARQLVKNQKLWASTSDSTGYTGMLAAIKVESGWTHADAEDHVLLWAASLADPSADPEATFGTAYDTEARPAGLGKVALDTVLGLVPHQTLYSVIHVVSVVESTTEMKIGTSVKRSLDGHSFASLLSETSEVVVPTGWNDTTGDAKYTIYAGSE
jgi:hypothetical protein